MKKAIYLGRSGKHNVCFNTRSAYNGHITILGKSGAGKSVAAQKLLVETMREADEVPNTVLSFNSHECLSEESIYKPIREEFRRYASYYAAEDGEVCIPLFKNVMTKEGKEESDINTIMAITNALAKPFNLQSRQRVALRKAVEQVKRKGTYTDKGIAAIGAELLSQADDIAENVYDKMYSIFGHNVINDGEFFLKRGSINIVELNHYDTDSQAVIIEILLSQLWRLALADQLSDYGNIYIFIDEVQNISYASKGMLSTLLAEGRKFNINLILATQILTFNSSNPTQRKMLQSGLMLYFQPSDSDISMTAKMIEPQKASQWMMELRSLRVGEFVASGPIFIDDVESMGPITVSGVSDSEASKPPELNTTRLDTRAHFIDPK